jgi:hypothetical protein
MSRNTIIILYLLLMLCSNERELFKYQTAPVVKHLLMKRKTGSRYGRYMEVNYFTPAEVSCGIHLRITGYDTVMNRRQ